MRCPQCHTENRSNAKFCDECGFDLRALTDEQAGGPAAPAPASETPEAVEEAGASDEAPAAADATAETTEAPADADSAPSAETPRPTFQPLSVAAEAQALFGPKPQAAPSASAEITADLSGLERLVDSSYVPPSYSGRTGDTMETYFFDFTVNSAYLTSDYAGRTPGEGNVLLVADITVKNTFEQSN